MSSAPPDPAPPPAAPAAPPPRQRSGWRLAAGLLAGLVLLGTALAGALGWALGSSAGARSLLGLLPDLQVQGLQGSLLGDLRIAQLRWRLGSRRELIVDALAWQGLRLSWPGGEAPQLQIDRLTARRVDLQGPSDNPDPVVLPEQLVLPLAVRIGQVQIDEVLFDAIRPTPVQGLAGRLELAAGPAAQHRLEGLQARWDRLAAEGEARLGAAAPLPLQARLQLTPVPPRHVASAASAATGATSESWARDATARLSATGPLGRLQVHAELRGGGQSLQADAEVAPVAPWPLPWLRARFERFDLAPLASGLPRTALSGAIDAHFDAAAGGRASQPLGLEATLDNALPGRLDVGRLPLHRLRLQAQAPQVSASQGRVTQLQLALADGALPAGQLEAQGHWSLVGPAGGRRLELTLGARLQGVRPAAVHPAAPRLHLGGPLTLTLGWPLDRVATPAERADAPSTGLPRRLGPAGSQLGLRSDLTGHLIGAGLPAVRLRLELQGEPEELRLETLQAESGAARLQAQARLKRQPQAWALQLDSRLQAFDPLVWWPGHAGHPLGRQRHRLDGQLQAALQWADRAPAGPPGLPQALAALSGEAALALDESLVAGVPVSGRLQLRSSHDEPALGPRPRLLAQLQLRAGPPSASRTELELLADLDPRHGQDRWSLRAVSPALQALAPWWRLLDAQQPLMLSGDLSGQLDLEGRWPRLRSRGTWQAGQSQPLRWQRVAGTAAAATSGQLQDLRATWQLGSQPEDTLELQAQAGEFRQDALRVLAPALTLTGRLASHRLEAQALLERSAEVPAASPEAPAAAARRLQLRAVAEGLAQLGTLQQVWSGRIAEASLSDAATTPGAGPGAAAGPAATSAGATRAASVALLRLTDLPLRLQHDDQALDVQAGPGRARLLDAGLQLQTFGWRQRSSGAEGMAPPPPEVRLRAQLEPLSIAPLLARAQPGFGWAGDLQVGGQIDLQTGSQGVSGEAELRRLQGDLQVEDPDHPEGPQRLGLVELRLAARVRDGLWRLSQQVSGGNLGRLEGEQTVTAPVQALWPPDEAPLGGRLDLRIDQLGHWGRWLPAGWRLSGQLASHASLAGRFGAPQFSGQLLGQQIAVRNLLQGVDWRDAAIRVALDGERARIEQFSVQAGTGRLDATGQIELGETPQLLARIEATRFAALQRIDRRIVASGSAELRLDARRSSLRGRLSIDEGRFDFTQRDAPSLADDVTIEREDRARNGAERSGSASRGPQRSHEMDLRVDLGRQLHLAGRGLATRLTGELRLTTPGSRLAIHGDVQAEDGSYTAYGQKLGIDRGIILFGGAPDNPRLDIEATKRDLEDLRVGVAITGTAQSPRVRLFSEPEMTETDKLSYLLLGRASDGLGRTDLALLQRAAFALITGEDDSPSLIERIGLDELSLRKDDGDTRETVVTLGKQLGRRWYLGYERNLNAATGTWQLLYRAAQRFTLRAQTGAENALDLIWTWKWGPGSLLPFSLPGTPPSAGRATAPARPASGASAPAR
ncbi:MAG: translocation/assembly module TamB domain-containing protein [Burkholderiaceae bacterium]|nr:translocation/assembly module TamB domain-containing protein [Burkholderiaceae bacterium]